MTYLEIHRNSYRFQIAVPADLKYLIGKSPLRMPIGRIPALAARRVARVLSGHAEKLFTAVRMGDFGAVTQDDLRDEIIKELSEMVEALINQLQDVTASADKRVELAVRKIELSMRTEHFQQQKDFSTKLQKLGGSLANVQEQVKNLPSRPGSKKIDALEDAVSALARQMLSLTQNVETSLDGGRPRPLLLDVLEDWTQMRRGLAIDEKKIKTDYNRISDFCDFAGNKPVNKYSYFDFQKWSNLLVRVPQNHNKISEIREMTREEAADYNDRLPSKSRLPTLTEKTIDTNYLSPLRTFFKDMAAEYEFRSPLSDVEIRISAAAAESIERQPFGTPELNRWFKHAAKETRADMKWLPLLGSVTGARIGELIYLQGKDVYQMSASDGSQYWVLDLRTNIITNEGTEKKRKLKNKSSRRLIALHSCFETAGFIAYAQTRSADEWLFPASFYYGKTRVKDPADAASKRMNRMLREVGIHAPLERVFHSTRHTAKDIMRLAKVDERTHDLQTGHAFKSPSQSYGSKSLRKEEIEVLRSIPLPDGLDLSPYFETKD